MKNLITCLVVCVMSGAALADTWTVDDDGKADFDNIQAAIDAASDGDECGTVLTSEVIKRTNQMLDDGTWDRARMYSLNHRGTQYIRITSHIVRYSDGSDGLAEDRVATAIKNLNDHVATTGLVFFQFGDTIYLDSDQYAYCDSSEADALRQIDSVSGSVNIYFVPLFDYCGLSSFYGSGVQGIVMANDCTANPSVPNYSTFSHEVGHYFNLYHTHTTYFGVECVDGSNCDSAGDLFCDTPADPNIYGWVTDACVYTGVEDDACGSGAPYNPSTENLMSYSNKWCRDTFTSEQLSMFLWSVENQRADHIVNGNTIWSVDDNGGADFDNIQAAVDASSDGDEILVYPGTYTGDGYNVIDLMGKSLWLHSSDGPAATIIDGEYERRGILYENVINGTIEGFTIQNCRAEPFDYGWGIYQLGGGIFVFNASIGIHNCIIDNNDTTGSGIGWGAGVFCQWSDEIVVTDCTFTNNRTDGSGGGLAILDSTVQMNDCTFDNNDTSGANLGWGGGFYTSNTDATYANCTFTNNTADRDGAGIFHYSSTFELENCSIKFNTAVEGGGGLALQNGSGIATQCTISHNTAVTGLLGTLGAGILNYQGEITLADTTVCGNNPDQINGSWIDNGGNTVDSECPVECPDINGDGYVNLCDLLIVIDYWGTADSPADLNLDGIVDVTDLLIVVGNWGPCP